jgi:hypothetical protein
MKIALFLALAAVGCDAALPAPSAPASAPLRSCPRWRALPQPPSCTGHTATRLLDGRVLVIGMCQDGAGEQSALVYDPREESWRALEFPQRSQHTATRLPSGEVLVAGGQRWEIPLSSVVTFRADASGWREEAPLATARAAHAAAGLGGGRVLVTGGFSLIGLCGSPYETESSAELFEPDRGWRPAGQMQQARAYAATARLRRRQGVLVIGGDIRQRETSAHGLETTERFNLRLAEWTAATPLPHAALRPTATELADGRVLVVGEDVTPAHGRIYDPAARTWSETAELPFWRTSHAAVRLRDGRVLIVGQSAYEHTEPAEIYDPGVDRWTLTAVPAGHHVSPTATRLEDGRVLVVGDGTEIFEDLCAM